MGEPKNISQDFQAQPNAIASFDYIDIAEGTGIRKFFCAISEDSTGNDYHLLTQEVYSDEIEVIETTFGNATFAKEADLDFDLSLFNKPQILRGTGFFTFSTGELSSCAAGKSVEYYFIFRVKKNDVEIASAQSKTYGFGFEAVPAQRAETAFFPITIPRTHYKKGDVLRLTLEIWTRDVANDGATGFLSIGVDPMDRDGTYIIPTTDSPTTTTKCEVYIPFEIDI